MVNPSEEPGKGIDSARSILPLTFPLFHYPKIRIADTETWFANSA